MFIYLTFNSLDYVNFFTSEIVSKYSSFIINYWFPHAVFQLLNQIEICAANEVYEKIKTITGVLDSFSQTFKISNPELESKRSDSPIFKEVMAHLRKFSVDNNLTLDGIPATEAWNYVPSECYLHGPNQMSPNKSEFYQIKLFSKKETVEHDLLSSKISILVSEHGMVSFPGFDEKYRNFILFEHYYEDQTGKNLIINMKIGGIKSKKELKILIGKEKKGFLNKIKNMFSLKK